MRHAIPSCSRRRRERATMVACPLTGCVRGRWPRTASRAARARGPVAVVQGGKPAIGSESSVSDLGVETPKQFGKTAPDSVLCLLDVWQADRREQRPARSVGVVVGHLLGLGPELNRPVTALRNCVVSYLLQPVLAITLDDPCDRHVCAVESQARIPCTILQSFDQRVVVRLLPGLRAGLMAEWRRYAVGRRGHASGAHCCTSTAFRSRLRQMIAQASSSMP